MEPSKKIKIYMGITSNGNVIDSQAYLLRDLLETYQDHVEFVYPAQCVRRMFHDFARNVMVDDFLVSDCDVLWFLDSDITPSAHILDLIALHWDKWKVAGATYPVFMNPPGQETPEVIFTAYKKHPTSGNLALAHVPQEGTDFLDGLATGCLFIKREVFSQLEKPYFEFKFDPATRNMTEGEDLGFCRKLSALGIQFFTDYSLVCKHQKTVDLLDINNYAISYANKSVLGYDAQIKATVDAALKKYYAAGYEQALKDIDSKLPKKHKVLSRPSQIWTP